jgi:acetylornithine deacetylase/succinyl-diaminopimelate desuccinylase-like protein
MIEQAVAHAHAQSASYLAGFTQLLRIPSVSTDPAYAADIQRAATWITDHMREIGLENVAIYPAEGGHPALYGEWTGASDSAPTVLLYAHYDVQPPDPLEEWESPPFEPTLREGKLYARGVADDKSGVWIILKAIDALLKTEGRLPLNVKLIFEGMEEAGSLGMDAFIRDHQDLLACDLIIIADGGASPARPVILSGVRGVTGAEVRVQGPAADLHSGLLGGGVNNPLHVVGKIIASFHDDAGNILIPGYYDDVLISTEAERQAMAALDEPRIEAYHDRFGEWTVWGDAAYSFTERTTVRPTLDVNGIYGGYQGAGGKTIIPASGGFKVTMRLVPDQDPADILDKFVTHVMGFEDESVSISIEREMAYVPSLMLPAGSPAVEALQRAYEAAWGMRASVERAGGSVPIVSLFEQHLDAPITNLSLSIGGQIHSPNEYLWVDFVEKGIVTTIHALAELADALKG